MASYGAGGTQGGKALGSPLYDILSYSTIIGPDLFTPGSAFEFQRVTGPQKIVMTVIAAGQSASWTFYIKGGSNASSCQVLPLVGGTYPGTINYVPDSFPPRGCIVATEPQPVGTTRINVFRVTELVTGGNLEFLLAWSPFCSVPPIINLVSGLPPPGFQQLEMDIFFYRTPPNMRMSGTKSSFGAPEYVYKSFDTLIQVPEINSGAEIPFRRYNGQQEIVVTDVVTGTYFSFEMDFGIIGQANGYIGFVSPTGNAVQPRSQLPTKNCTIENLASNTPHSVIQIESYKVTDSFGRVFIFTFDPNPYTQIPPTIKLESGPPLANGILVQSVFVKFDSL